MRWRQLAWVCRYGKQRLPDLLAMTPRQLDRLEGGLIYWVELEHRPKQG